MNHNHHLDRVDQASTGTLKLNINTVPISSTKGSAEWLLSHGAAEVKFHEINESQNKIRVADLNIAGETLRVAAHGFVYVHEQYDWVTRDGIHSLPIYWEDFHSGTLLFGVILTPAAKAILEKAAEDVFTAFKAWIESDGE